MQPASDFARFGQTAYVALTIPPQGLLARAVDYITRHRSAEPARILARLLLALDQEEAFDLNDLRLLDANRRLVAMGLIHHGLVTGRLPREELHEAAMAIQLMLQPTQPSP